MTPKEKAKELVETFEDIEFEDSYQGEGGFDYFVTSIPTCGAKKCAIISCNIILKDAGGEEWKEPDGSIFWENVKQEIEKL